LTNPAGSKSQSFVIENSADFLASSEMNEMHEKGTPPPNAARSDLLCGALGSASGEESQRSSLAPQYETSAWRCRTESGPTLRSLFHMRSSLKRVMRHFSRIMAFEHSFVSGGGQFPATRW